MFEKGHKVRRNNDPSNNVDTTKTLSKTVLKHGSYLEACQTAPKSKGRDLYVKYIMENARLSFKQAITAQCAHCMGWYVDGRHDCECPDCPLYPFMPYGKYRKVRIQSK
jgi:hypothetical protein